MSPESSTNSPESSKVRRKIHNSGDTSGFRRAPIRIFFTLLKPDRYPLFEYEPGNIQNTINPPTSNSYSRANGGKKNGIKKLGSRTIPWCLTTLWMAPDSSYVFGFGAVFFSPFASIVFLSFVRFRFVVVEFGHNGIDWRLLFMDVIFVELKVCVDECFWMNPWIW